MMSEPVIHIRITGSDNLYETSNRYFPQVDRKKTPRVRREGSFYIPDEDIRYFFALSFFSASVASTRTSKTPPESLCASFFSICSSMGTTEVSPKLESALTE